MAQGQDDRADHRHQQHHAGGLEEIDIVGVEHPADRLDIGFAMRRGDQGVSGRRALAGHGDGDEDHLGHQQRRHAQPDRQIAGEAAAQGREIHVQHHHHEQEQHRHRADIDDDQQHGQELGAKQDEQSRGIEEGEDGEQDRMDRIAGRDHGQSGAQGHRRQHIKGDRRQGHGPLSSPLVHPRKPARAEARAARFASRARLSDRARPVPDSSRLPVPSDRRYRAGAACRNRAPRGSPRRIRCSAPRRWRPPGRPPGTGRNRCI